MSSASCHVLLVEDRSSHVNPIAAHLRAAGHAVLIAGRSQQALAMLQECRRAGRAVDVVVARLGVPEADGLWLLREVQASDQPTAVALYAPFGSIDEARFAEAERLGCMTFLDEPVEAARLDQLLAAVRARMDRGGEDPFTSARTQADGGIVRPTTAIGVRPTTRVEGAGSTTARLRRGVTGRATAVGSDPAAPAPVVPVQIPVRCRACRQVFVVAQKTVAYATLCVHCGTLNQIVPAAVRIQTGATSTPPVAWPTAPAVRHASTGAISPPTSAAAPPPSSARSDTDTTLLSMATPPPGPKLNTPPSAITIAGYRILDLLGHGGMATVYRAIQVSLERPVALKVIAERHALDASFCQRFIREARIAGRISHPNVITCYDVGRDGSQLYMALELLTGGDAAQLAHARGGRLDERTALRLILDAARGLGALAAFGLIHRDIKPANLFITRDGSAKLADLGLARPSEADGATIVGGAIGTPAYMSPEQASGDIALDTRADIYSLGATLYALVCGRAPFVGATLWAVISKLLSEAPPDPLELGVRLSPSTLRLLQRMMARDRAGRHGIIDDLIAEIEGVLMALPTAPAPAIQRLGVVPSDLDRGETIVGVDLNR